jgi:hypothetical protein
VDLVGLSFVPLYRFLGPASMLVILVLFFVTISRLVFTVLFRVIVTGKAKGFYLFGALLGCVYQLIISPLKWADNAAQSMAKRFELGLIEGAEDNAGGSDGDGGGGGDCGGGGEAANGHYPDLNEARSRERRYLNWGPWYRRGSHYTVPQTDVALQDMPTEPERQMLENSASAPAKE